jgi:cation/acetate symporter
MILFRGLSEDTGGPGSSPYNRFLLETDTMLPLRDQGTLSMVPAEGNWTGKPYVRRHDSRTGATFTYRIERKGYQPEIYQGVSHEFALVSAAQTVTVTKDGKKLVNGLPWGRGDGHADLFPVGTIAKLPSPSPTGPIDPVTYISKLQNSTIVLWGADKIVEEDGSVTTVYYQKPTLGKDVLTPGGSPTFAGVRSNDWRKKLDFLSLMIALFCGTASLPHILIRYYTVKDQASARKSTVVGIASIGFFYILTLFLGLGAMTSGTLDVTDSNMAAPLLARSFGELPFAVISAIAFTTVLGTVSGLIMAGSGAVAHDIMANFLRIEMNDHSKVRAGKITAVVIGVIAMALGILFQKFNVTFLVGWAFNVAASANLPSLVMLLFWRGTTKQGITAAIFVGMISSLAWILLSQQCYRDVYGLPPEQALVPFSQPGIVTIPLGFVVLVVVSLITQGRSLRSAV